MNVLGILYKDQGQYSKALPLSEECLKLRKEILGDRHPDTLIYKMGLDNRREGTEMGQLWGKLASLLTS